MKRYQCRGTIVGATLAVLTATVVAQAEETRAVLPSPGSSILPMSRFYDGPTERIGNFPGKLICLGCDHDLGRDAAEQCDKEDRPPALAMDSDSMAHALLAGTMEVVKDLSSCDLDGREVTVHGKYYPVTGAILVDRITAKN